MPRSHRSWIAPGAAALLFALLVAPVGWAAPAGPLPARSAPSGGFAPAGGSLLDALRAEGREVPRADFPALVWGTADIIYGPGDDTTHFMGEGAAMVVDDAHRNITVFGGEGSGGLTDWTVNYNYSSGEFFITVPSPTPSPRTNVSFATVPGANEAVLFGGLTDLATQRTTNDTWVYYFLNQSWQNVTHGPAPPARESAAFAVNGSGRGALLEGGYSPRYELNGSSASVIWNDTWSLNLTTFRWTELTLARSPPPLFGSGMIWQNETDRYELFGGCALSCSNALYGFGGSPADWQAVSTSGTPTGRASSAFVWDAENDMAVVFGGFDWGTQGPVALGDGYLLDPATGAFSDLTAGGGPGPRFGAPNAWADFPGCIGLNLLGGNIALSGPPLNASVLEPLDAPSPNCFPYLVNGGGGPPPPPCSVNGSVLSVHVVDNLTGAGIANASVIIDGSCVVRTVTTDLQGFANLTIPAPDTLNLTASASGFRSDRVTTEFLPNTTNRVTLPLGPLPELRLRSLGESVGGIAPLANVTIEEGSALVLGRTDAAGYLNFSDIYTINGSVDLVGSRAGWSTDAVLVRVPYDGPFWANLTLLKASDLDVQVVSGAGRSPIAPATVVLEAMGPGSNGPTTLATDPAGWANLSSAPAGNYTIATSAPGYLPDETSVIHPWINATVLVVELAPAVGAVLDAELVDLATGTPIGRGQVTVGSFAPENATPAGWANFTDLGPPGLYPVTAESPGFVTNHSWVELADGERIDPYRILLKPILACPGAPGCPAASTTNATPFGFLPPGGGATTLLIVATPALLLLAGFTYAVFVARPRRAGPAAAGPPGAFR